MPAHTLKLKNDAIEIPKLSLPLPLSGLDTNRLHSNLVRHFDAVQQKIISPAQSAFRKVQHHSSLVRSVYQNYPFKKYAVRLFIAVMLLDSILFSLMLLRIYAPLSAAEHIALAAYAEPTAPEAFHIAPAPLGAGAAELVSQLQEQNMNVAQVETIKRAGLSVPGQLISINGDNILAFEYADADTAAKEASALFEKYSSYASADVWDARAHIYEKGPLVVFYLGPENAITAALSNSLGNALGQSIITPGPQNTSS